MIVRCWSGTVPARLANAFRAHLERTGLADYRAQPGCLGTALWSREIADTIRFTLVSKWTDYTAIAAYAGSDLNRAVLYPGDDAFELQPDLDVTHYALEIDEHFPCA